jgi:hypothetical protein
MRGESEGPSSEFIEGTDLNQLKMLKVVQNNYSLT